MTSAAGVEIVARWDHERVLFRSVTAASVGEVVVEAVRSGTSLRGADLDGAYLAEANLSGADLGWA